MAALSIKHGSLLSIEQEKSRITRIAMNERVFPLMKHTQERHSIKRPLADSRFSLFETDAPMDFSLHHDKSRVEYSKETNGISHHRRHFRFLVVASDDALLIRSLHAHWGNEGETNATMDLTLHRDENRVEWRKETNGIGRHRC